MTMWMIRAGRKASFIDDFREQGLVAIGWNELNDVPRGTTREEIFQKAAETYPKFNKNQLANLSGQIYRFINEIEIGDRIVSYDPSRRTYLLGTVKSEQTFSPERNPALPRIRAVAWENEVPRDQLSTSTKNSIGAISTLFQIPEAASLEITRVAAGERDSPDIEEAEDEADLLETVREQSKEFIKDRINRLDGYELQSLVAGVLRAMGYKTRVSAPGADRGIDILASPDGFGFESPRIVVECKHRPQTAMGSQEIRSFLGGRHKDDKGLFVSTGGFTKGCSLRGGQSVDPSQTYGS